MENFLVSRSDESVTVPGTVVRLLIQRGSGDAALLYLALLRHRGTMPPRSLAGELRWERERMEAAEAVLRDLQLLVPAAETALPAPADEKPEYTQGDIAEKIESSGEFRGLTTEVERRLGKRLSTPDLSTLLGLHDFMGLPPDVIYLLVCHCTEKIERRLGPGRRPGMRQIEKEGYAWARMGIDSQAEAAAYLKRYAERQSVLPQYMRVLQMADRPASPSEEKYLTAWQDMGFGPDAVALAYDKTVLRCHELKWPYLNGILKKWNEAGLHTVAEIEAGDRPGTVRQKQDEPERSGGNMRKYVEELHKTRQ